MVEIKKSRDAHFPSAGTINGQRHPVSQVPVNCPVPRHARRVDVLELEDHPLGLRLGHPLVQAQQGSPQAAFQKDLSTAAPFRLPLFCSNVAPYGTTQQASFRLFC